MVQFQRFTLHNTPSLSTAILLSYQQYPAWFTLHGEVYHEYIESLEGKQQVLYEICTFKLFDIALPLLLAESQIGLV